MDNSASQEPDNSALDENRLVSRRATLRMLGTGALGAGLIGLGGAGLVSGCSSGNSRSSDAEAGTTAETPSSSIVPHVPPYDPAKPYWEQGNFRSVFTESTLENLDVSGSLPSDISGLFVRNGSNSPTGKSLHWFLGDGMLHGVRIKNGRAFWYRNRYIDTPLHAKGKDILNFGGAPGKEISQSNVALVHHGGKLLATGEVGWPYEIKPTDLSTVGAWNFAGKLGDAMTAHPKIDPTTGKMHLFGYSFFEKFIRYYVAEPDGTISHSTTIPIDEAVMIHDFAITERDVLFWLGPVVFGADKTAMYPQVPFHWDPNGPAKIGVMPLGGTGDEMRWIDVDPFFVFHGLNAHREGNDVVAYVHRLAQAFGKQGDLEPSHLTEWRIGTASNQLTFAQQRVSELPMDLPTHDRRYTGRKLKHGWCVTTTDPKSKWGMELKGICHVNVESGSQDVWQPGDNLRGGEAVFIPSDSEEGVGYLVTFIWNRSTNTSSLSFFDAQHVAKGPVAQVHLPVRVPFGFHGLWLDEKELA